MTMDPRDYDRIADLLMQMIKKIQCIDPTRMPNIDRQTRMHYHLCEALELNHQLAIDDGKGWL